MTDSKCLSFTHREVQWPKALLRSLLCHVITAILSCLSGVYVFGPCISHDTSLVCCVVVVACWVSLVTKLCSAYGQQTCGVMWQRQSVLLVPVILGGFVAHYFAFHVLKKRRGERKIQLPWPQLLQYRFNPFSWKFQSPTNLRSSLDRIWGSATAVLTWHVPVKHVHVCVCLLRALHTCTWK